MIIDLHCHTTCSDGELSPQELINLAVEKNIEMLAITDHDCVDAYKELENIDIPDSLKIITGIEFSTCWSGIGVHIVGLNIDIKSKPILQAIEFQKNARINRAELIISKLKKQNIEITYADLVNQAGHNNIGRPHIARHLVEKGFVTSIDKAFKKYLKNNKIGSVKQSWAKIEQIITWINEAGGIAIIAHPNKYKMTRTKQKHFIDEFINMGGKGIEIISGWQLEDLTNKYIKLANDKNLLASIGSDFHRIAKYQATLGVEFTNMRLENIDNVNFVWDNLIEKI